MLKLPALNSPARIYPTTAAPMTAPATLRVINASSTRSANVNLDRRSLGLGCLTAACCCFKSEVLYEGEIGESGERGYEVECESSSAMLFPREGGNERLRNA